MFHSLLTVCTMALAAAQFSAIVQPFSALMSHPSGAATRGSPAANSAAQQQPQLGDGDGEEVFVESSWRAQVVSYDREQQCEPFVTKDVAVQSKQRVAAGVRFFNTTLHRITRV
jgi:hypothetical protein